MRAPTAPLLAERDRRFEVDGTVWIARIAGRSLTGLKADRGAPLLHVTFHPGEGSGPPERELLLIGRSLDPYRDEELPELLHRSVPYRPPEPPEPDRRRPRRKGRR